jgi:carbonic anhydrase/acetyltransferase-like protein (isoleucine patch superfamily)
MGEDIKLVDALIKKYDVRGFYHTGPIGKPEPNTLYFVKNLTFIYEYILNSKKIKSIPNVHIIIPQKYASYLSAEEYPNTKFYPADDVLFVFGEIHNYIHANLAFYTEPNIDNTSVIHSTASLTTDGIHMYHTPHGYKKHLKHISNVKIKSNSTIGAYTVIHKGVFEPTVIGHYVTIGSLVNIGHNCNIGDHTVITPGVTIAGSCNIGKNCWIGCGATIKHFTNVCDDVIIGQHSNVLHNIVEPGTYAGNPLKKIGPYRVNWNF